MDIRRYFNQKPPKLAGESSSDVMLGESPGCRSSQDVDSTPDSAEASGSSCQGLKQGSSQVAAPGDLGVEKPNQVILKNFPARVFSGKKRSRDWLEYSIYADAAFCYPCKTFRAPSCATDTTFTIIGFCDWEHAVETGKGLNKHSASREHQTCEPMWRDKERRIQTGRRHGSVNMDLRSETEFVTLLKRCKDATIEPVPNKRRHTLNTSFAMYAVEEIIIYEDLSDDTELRRMYFSCIDAVCGEMKERFGERNCVLMDALRSLDPEDFTFLDVSKVKPLLDLTNTPIVESEYTVAHQFLSVQMKDSFPADGGKWTMKKVPQHFQKPLKAMPSVMTALKHALTFGASTALCENSFSTLNVLTEHCFSMFHRRKANLVPGGVEGHCFKKIPLCRTTSPIALLM
ncbi:hypothetical protein DPX16_3283 [Anabarilius grahami]|uniref:TTF-type domain-containing protein n=1 Tax=Anabarilius grahami TaxID=495550 RepID=A0A3N0XR88_ANAGA|nr:hypothetical protein DPX16_3283 [Anabarilius grahami]